MSSLNLLSKDKWNENGNQHNVKASKTDKF